MKPTTFILLLALAGMVWLVGGCSGFNGAHDFTGKPIQDMPPLPTVSQTTNTNEISNSLVAPQSVAAAPVAVMLSVPRCFQGIFLGAASLTNAWQPLNATATNRLQVAAALPGGFFRFQATAWQKHLICDPLAAPNAEGVFIYANDGERFTFGATNDFVFWTTNFCATNFCAAVFVPWPNPDPDFSGNGIATGNPSNTATDASGSPRLSVSLATN
jgi:hypothetical protein